jgi:prostaglandin-endoperoxide synthase 2
MGRDFRVQGFNAYRERFGLARLAGWDDVTGDDHVKGALKALYRDVDQIELFVGLMAEQSKDGALFGLLLNTMVASDAFTQALTNPLLSQNVFTEANFTRFGLGEIAATPSLQALVDRNVLGGSNVKASFAA